MLRVRNEARWIDRVIRSLQPLCRHIFVMDDGSTDQTPAICQAIGATVFNSPFQGQGVNETRDKNWLLQKIWDEVNPKYRGPESQDWIVQVDGDEELYAKDVEIVRASAVGANALTFRIIYLWDRPDQIRMDGIYGTFKRGSAFRMVTPLHEFRRTTGANFHCGSIPKALLNQANDCPARLLHYGYMERSDRIRKYEFYNRLDPDNRIEDRYRHMIQGDGPFVMSTGEQVAEIPPDLELRHAGPIQLCALAN